MNEIEEFRNGLEARFGEASACTDRPESIAPSLNQCQQWQITHLQNAVMRLQTALQAKNQQIENQQVSIEALSEELQGAIAEAELLRDRISQLESQLSGSKSARPHWGIGAIVRFVVGMLALLSAIAK